MLNKRYALADLICFYTISYSLHVFCYIFYLFLFMIIFSLVETDLNGMESGARYRCEPRVGEQNVTFNSVVRLNEPRKPATLWLGLRAALSLWPLASWSSYVGEWNKVAGDALSDHDDIVTMMAVSCPLRHSGPPLGGRDAVGTVAWRFDGAVAVEHRSDVDMFTGKVTCSARTPRRRQWFGDNEKYKNQSATYTSARKPSDIPFPVTATSGYQ